MPVVNIKTHSNHYISALPCLFQANLLVNISSQSPCKSVPSHTSGEMNCQQTTWNFQKFKPPSVKEMTSINVSLHNICTICIRIATQKKMNMTNWSGHNSFSNNPTIVLLLGCIQHPVIWVRTTGWYQQIIINWRCLQQRKSQHYSGLRVQLVKLFWKSYYLVPQTEHCNTTTLNIQAWAPNPARWHQVISPFHL